MVITKIEGFDCWCSLMKLIIMNVVKMVKLKIKIINRDMISNWVMLLEIAS